jgi:hypothetical protein
MRYRVNAPQVIAETIGEETMIVNLAKGHYFNLQGAGVDVWECIERGGQQSEMLALLEARYVAADGEIEGSVSRLLAELEAEELIVATEVEVSPMLPSAMAQSDTTSRTAFVLPPLAKFTDMQDIILLDPVHEVEPRGWPHAPASA